jgi:RNA-directed DNA polymerase
LRNKLVTIEMGVPQGGPLSPLLRNFMLNELDKELESKGHKFVRYADDMVILCSGKRSAERVMGSIICFIEDKLFLKVNREKSRVVPTRAVKFLGYSFYKLKGECRRAVCLIAVQGLLPSPLPANAHVLHSCGFSAAIGCRKLK